MVNGLLRIFFRTWPHATKRRHAHRVEQSTRAEAHRSHAMGHFAYSDSAKIDRLNSAMYFSALMLAARNLRAASRDIRCWTPRNLSERRCRKRIGAALHSETYVPPPKEVASEGVIRLSFALIMYGNVYVRRR